MYILPVTGIEMVLRETTIPFDVIIPTEAECFGKLRERTLDREVEFETRHLLLVLSVLL
jgi:hypothetical protein